MMRVGVLVTVLLAFCWIAAGAPVISKEYRLPVFPREDTELVDAETGVALRFLTRAEHKDTNLYFHQRSWMADSSMIFFFSSRPKGGVMGYIVETGELVQITAADGAKLRHPTAALLRNSLFAMAGDRVLEIELRIEVKTRRTGNRAEVTARERHICTVRGIDVYLNESCDGRYLASGGKSLEGGTGPGLVLIDTATGAWERLCGMPEGVEYHGHVQWSISNPYWLSFAGAPNRLWVVDIRDRVPWCPYRELPGELVTHESWWVGDELIFCGGLRPKPTEDSHLKAIDMRGGTVRILGEGSWWPEGSPSEIAKRNWWHAAGSPDGRWMAADNWHGDIMLFDRKTSRPHLLTTGHRSYGGGEHPEVGWDRAGRQVIFGSHLIGTVTVCVATIPESWQRDLDKVQIGLEAK